MDETNSERFPLSGSFARDSYDAVVDQALISFESFERTGDAVSLDEAIHLATKCIDHATATKGPMTKILDKMRPIIMCNIPRKSLEPLLKIMVEQELDTSANTRSFEVIAESALCFEKLFKINRDVEHIDRAIELARQAIIAASGDRNNQLDALYNLGIFLDDKYEATRSLETIDEAISISREAMTLITEKGEPLAEVLTNLVGRLGTRYKRKTRFEDLEEAVESAREALSLTSDDCPSYMIRSRMLVNSLGLLSDRTKQSNELEKVVKDARLVVDSIPRNRPDCPAAWADMSQHYHRLYDQTREMRDLREATSWCRGILQFESTLSFDHNKAVRRLAGLLTIAYEREGDIHILEEAIHLTRELVANDFDHGSTYSDLSHLLFRLYEHTQSLDAIEESVQQAERAFCTLRDPDDRIACLSHLGCALAHRYSRTGNSEDLNRAIHVTTQASENSHDPHARETTLSNLGAWLLRRYERTQELFLLEGAISNLRQAMESRTFNGHALFSKVSAMANLSSCLHLRYKRLGQLYDLNVSGYLLLQAITLSDPGNVIRRAVMVGNLGMLILDCYLAANDDSLLQEAINLELIAVEKTPEESETYKYWLINTAIMFHRKYYCTDVIEDLEEAISLNRKALHHTLADRPEHAQCLLGLGSTLASKYHVKKESKILDEATTSFSKAVDMSAGQPLHRIHAATQCLDLLCEADLSNRNLETGVTIGKSAIGLLPLINLRGLNRDDQQHLVAEISGMASNILAINLSAGLVKEGIESLEQGRAVIIGQVLDTKSDFSALGKTHPEVVSRLRGILDSINDLYNTTHHFDHSWGHLDRRRNIIQDFESCLAGIRTLQGHDRFLMSATALEMEKLASDGWIVVVNITRLRSDAVLISRYGTKALHLPDLDWVNAKAWRVFTRWKRSRSELNKVLVERLQWLWYSCVKCVVRAITADFRGQTRNFHGDRHRVWWIGVGLASGLPFHASGDYGEYTTSDSTENAMAHLISSYTPSFKALSHSRHHISSHQVADMSLLLVNMAETPTATGATHTRKKRDHANLVDECPNIKSAAGPYVEIECLTQPSAGQVMSKIGDHPIVHFGCHGISDKLDPSNSSLILQKLDSETREAQRDHLSLRQISHAQLPRARLAYLSACSTAHNKAERLLDEVLHVTSGFQVAGFPHVIGCLWEADDKACLAVSRRFYPLLLSKGASWMTEDPQEVAIALHDAIEEYRREPLVWRDPFRWAPFVHFGA